MADSIHAQRKLRRAAYFGLDVAEPGAADAPMSMSNTKAELLVAAEAAGVEADDSMTKADILEALGG